MSVVIPTAILFVCPDTGEEFAVSWDELEFYMYTQPDGCCGEHPDEAVLELTVSCVCGKDHEVYH